MTFDPRNPSGEPRKEAPAPSANPNHVPMVDVVTQAFDPRNPSGENRNAPIKPKLVNEQPFNKGMIAKYNLFINYYVGQNEERQKELIKCVNENAKNFDNIIVIASQDDFDHIQSLVDFDFTAVPTSGERATYMDYFDLISVFSDPNQINIIANLDIIIPVETLINCVSYFTDSTVKRVLALTRWDIKADGSVEFFNRTDSQDVWIFQGDVEKGVNANFALGEPGCDNAIANRLEVAGYEVLNPSLTLKTYHQHLVPIRSYLNEKGEQKQKGIPPPYKHLVPTT